MTLFERLKRANADVWQAYAAHDFVSGMQSGELPRTAFQYYLVQDYLFLIQFARAYALAAYKAETLDDMRAATATMTALLDTEMSLHVRYCAEWGISEQQILAVEEDPRNMAYTRYVLEKGLSGDSLDLHVALAPCVVGYGEIGRRLADSPDTRRDRNPYMPWIDMYAGDDYQGVAAAAVDRMDRLAASRFTEARFDSLSATFRQATRLEADFWQMGLDHA
jgi:thiaminase/transcriptional activator TenA